MRNICLSLIIFSLLMLTGCGDDENTSITNPGKTSRVLFELTETDDNRISEVDVLAFKVDENDDSKEYFSYRVQGENIADDGAPNKKQFDASLLKGGTSKYRFVVLSNCRKTIDDLGEINTSALKENLLNRLISHHEGIWSTNSNDENYSDIPMWCETSQMYINDDAKTITGLFLLRMLARIDVTIDPSIQSKFKLKNVRLYNYNTYGHIVPLTDALHWNGSIVLAPTIPTSPGKTLGPVVYNQMTTPDIALTKSIYLYETAAATEDNGSEATCLVLGGEYNNEGKESYYRVDLINSGNSSYVDILRNHLYNIRISNVSNTGHDTPEDAFNSQPVNMESDVSIWEEGSLSDVIIDGSYRSTISQSEFKFPLDQRTAANTDNKLTLSTNYPSGWSVEKIVDENDDPIGAIWLTLSRYGGSTNEVTTFSILTDANISGKVRTGYIHFKFERIIYVVKVIQTTTSEVDITLKNNNEEEITSMLFYAHVESTVPSQNLFVKWVPASANLNIITNPVIDTTPFDFGSGDKIITETINDQSGTKTYTIQPPAITQAEINVNPFIEKAVQVNYTIEYGASIVSKTLYLIQKNFAAIPTIDPSYLMDGTEKYFTIHSNAPWKIEITNDPQNVIQQLITTSGGLGTNKVEEKVYFKIINDITSPTIFESDVALTIKSSSPLYPFADIPVTLSCTSNIPKFSIICESISANGVYETNRSLDASNTITLNVDVEKTGTYSITTQTVDGISFSASGEFFTTGVQTITLQGNGTPSTTQTKMMEFMTNSEGSSNSGCSARVRMIIPKKTMLSLGTNGWAIHSSSGIANMFNNPLNYGSDINSTFKTYKPDVNPAGQFLTNITATILQPYLEPVSGNPVDIVIMTYNADLSGAAASTMMANYVKKGGVLIMLNEHNKEQAANFNFIKGLFNDETITGTDNAAAAGTVLQLPTNDDEILNGAFGDVREKYIGEDGGFGDVFTYLPTSELDWIVTSVDYSGTGGNPSQIYAFKAKNYNFFWCGDGGMASSNGSTGYTTYPVTLTASPNYKPSSRLYGRNAGNRHFIDNATFFANIIAWGMQQAEFNGINTIRRNKTKQR